MAKMYEEMNRKLPARNTRATFYPPSIPIDPERHNAERYKRTDRLTDNGHYDAMSQ